MRRAGAPKLPIGVESKRQLDPLAGRTDPLSTVIAAQFDTLDDAPRSDRNGDPARRSSDRQQAWRPGRAAPLNDAADSRRHLRQMVYGNRTTASLLYVRDASSSVNRPAAPSDALNRRSNSAGGTAALK